MRHRHISMRWSSSSTLILVTRGAGKQGIMMTLKHLAIMGLAFACLLALVLPSCSGDIQVSHKQRNVGEPNKKARNLNEKKKEKTFNRRRNRKEKKIQKNKKKQQNKKEKKMEKQYKKKYKKKTGKAPRMAGPCTGTTSDWSCCSNSNPCQEKQGDCDADSQCAGTLICGKDNCRDFNAQAHSIADCCVKPPALCSGTTSDWSCCSSSSPCPENQGDCDNDSECAGSLVCGNNNCKSYNPLAHSAADCCVKPAGCSGTTSDWSCCSSSSPCQENQGDCDNDLECAGSLVCGNDNCKSMNPLAHGSADCCIQQQAPSATCIGTTSDWNCCSSSSPCQENQGDCDYDSDCAGSLVCGNDNCYSINPLAHGAADCCIQSSVVTPINGQWSSWSSWSGCSVTSGSPTKIRIRTCSNPLPSGGGNQCSGVARETASCSLPSCKCGVKKQGTRIVGGSVSQVNEYPWMVLLSMGCGGSVVADRWILTAAHCFYRNQQFHYTSPGAITITLGEHDTTISTETLLTKHMIPDQIIIHDSYDPSTDTNDLALLRLPSAIDVTVYTPACLPPPAEDYTNQTVWVYGWGSLSEGGSLSATLQELEITVVNDNVAKKKFGLTDTQLAAMVFAGGKKGKDACQGDSGGPLSYERKGRHELVGATSWGYGCAREGYPGAYTELSAFRSWIDQKISGSNTCTTK